MEAAATQPAPPQPAAPRPQHGAEGGDAAATVRAGGAHAPATAQVGLAPPVDANASTADHAAPGLPGALPGAAGLRLARPLPGGGSLAGQADGVAGAADAAQPVLPGVVDAFQLLAEHR